MCKMTLLETFGVIMKNMQLYVGGTNRITYRYDIQKAGDIFNVRIFSVADRKHTEAGTKAMHHITVQDVINECLSHYRKKANGASWFLRWFCL